MTGSWKLAHPLMWRVFQCVCERPVFFGNSQCLHCGRALGYVPELGLLVPVEASEPDETGALWHIVGEHAKDVAYRRCSNLDTAASCNWLLTPEQDMGNGLCRCCRLNRVVPDTSTDAHANLWHRAEVAKRRLISSLIALGLPVASRIGEDVNRGMAFDLLVNAVAPVPVMTGHQNGIITLNVEEADDAVREAMRSAMQEPYRTVLGHLRHESGHYYWTRMLDGGPFLEPYRALFGDEREDYGTALANYHANGPQPNWEVNFVSAYASAHPWEDWAETWAHYLHMLDALETALSSGIEVEGLQMMVQDPFDASALYTGMQGADAAVSSVDPEADQHFLAFVNAWVALTGMVNELSRSLGQPDFYPFVMNVAVVTKLHFIHRFVAYCRTLAADPPAIEGILSVAGEEDPGAALDDPGADTGTAPANGADQGAGATAPAPAPQDATAGSGLSGPSGPSDPPEPPPLVDEPAHAPAATTA